MEVSESQLGRLWPNCGRERCINCAKVTLREFLISSSDPIQYGRPSPGTMEREVSGVFHYDRDANEAIDAEIGRRHDGLE